MPRRASAHACAVHVRRLRVRSGGLPAAAAVPGRRLPSRRRNVSSNPPTSLKAGVRNAAAPPQGPTGSDAFARSATGRFQTASHERSVVSSSIPAESTSCGRSCCRRTPATIAMPSSCSGSSSRSRNSGSQTTSLLMSTTTSVLGHGDATVDGAAEADVVRQLHDPSAGEPLSEQLFRPIGRRIVDNDDVVCRRLALESFERLREQPAPVEGGNDDGRSHVGHDSASGECFGDDPRSTLDAGGGRPRRPGRAGARRRLRHRNAACGRYVGLSPALPRPGRLRSLRHGRGAARDRQRDQRRGAHGGRLARTGARARGRATEAARQSRLAAACDHAARDRGGSRVRVLRLRRDDVLGHRPRRDRRAAREHAGDDDDAALDRVAAVRDHGLRSREGGADLRCGARARSRSAHRCCRSSGRRSRSAPRCSR